MKPEQITDMLISDSDGNQNNFTTDSNLMIIGTDDGDTTALGSNLQDNCVFHETDTNKDYIWDSDTGEWNKLE